MDKIEVPPPAEATWQFEGGGVYAEEEAPVTVVYGDQVVTITVGFDEVKLAVGHYGKGVARAIYAAMTMTDPR